MPPRLLIIAASALLCVNLYAQSLGDVAREQQQKKNQQQSSTNNSASKKVLTNDDMPAVSSPSGGGQSPASDKATKTDSSKPSGATWSAEKLKTEIQKRKDAIAEIQKAIDKIQGSINYVQNNRNIYINAPEYNAHQDEKQRLVNQLKGKLAEQQSELEDLQEQARQAGFGGAVYQ